MGDMLILFLGLVLRSWWRSEVSLSVSKERRLVVFVCGSEERLFSSVLDRDADADDRKERGNNKPVSQEDSYTTRRPA